MIELKGKCSDAKVFTDLVEQEAISQIIGMLNQPITKNATVRIMADCHAGKGCTIGTTIVTPKEETLRLCPNIVGVDIGCNMSAYKLADIPNLKQLDRHINQSVPSGFETHAKTKHEKQQIKLLSGLTFKLQNEDHILKSLGTLGGGNHFIELGKTDSGEHWLVIHSGSRNLGLQIAKHHQNVAIANRSTRDTDQLIASLRASGREREIESAIRTLKREQPTVPKELAYLKDNLAKDYLNDMLIAKEWAMLNHETMSEIIFDKMGWNKPTDMFHSMHNFIDTLPNGDTVIRKGATSALDGQRLIIPINMRDGSIFATGKGNADYNFSAPHGAGRLMSRSQAKATLSLDDMKDEMSGIYSTSISFSTLDEAPMAYKPIETIIENIGDTVTIDEIVKPIYNFKAHD